MDQRAADQNHDAEDQPPRLSEPSPSVNTNTTDEQAVVGAPPPTSGGSIRATSSLMIPEINKSIKVGLVFIVALLQVKTQSSNDISISLLFLLAIGWYLLHLGAHLLWLRASSSSQPLSSSSSSPSTTSRSIISSSSLLIIPNPAKVYILKYTMVICGLFTKATLLTLFLPSSTQHYAPFIMYAIILLLALLHWAHRTYRALTASRNLRLPLHAGDLSSPLMMPQESSSPIRRILLLPSNPN